MLMDHQKKIKKSLKNNLIFEKVHNNQYYCYTKNYFFSNF